MVTYVTSQIPFKTEEQADAYALMIRNETGFPTDVRKLEDGSYVAIVVVSTESVEQGREVSNILQSLIAMDERVPQVIISTKPEGTTDTADTVPVLVQGIATKKKNPANKEYQKAYQLTEAFRESQRRYQEGPGGRAAQRKYALSDQGKAARKAYQDSPKGRAARARYLNKKKKEKEAAVTL